ncbi:MAG: protein kinase [Phycisphaerales bacterium]|nr:MAG: protein kinase [Phycisphaerales bacterium]
MIDCLTDEQLERYVAGGGAAEETVAIESHIDACSACRERLSRKREKEDFLEGIRPAYDEAKARAIDAEPLGEELVSGYRILEEIHRGGQGAVYKAIQQSTDRTVALKVILGGPVATEQARKRFEREAKLAASLSHSNIVAVHDSGAIDDNLFIVMDYIDGLPITDYAAEERLPIAERLRLFVTVCEAVEYAHEHDVLHRDLKPANILVTGEGKPVIVDFGLARPLRAHEDGESATIVSSPGQVVGSLPYISPEQATGDPTQIDERTDVYALGVLLYELLTGTRPPPIALCQAQMSPGLSPIEPAPPSRACLGLDRRLDTIVMKAIERVKARRYRSAGDFAMVVRTYLDRPDMGLARRAGWLGRLARVALPGLVAYASLATALALLQRQELARRPPIPPDPPSAEGLFRVVVDRTWAEDYHGHLDEPFVTDDFEDYWPGMNPPLLDYRSEDPYRGLLKCGDSDPHPRKASLWEHFEGINLLGSEGLSNLYITRFWPADVDSSQALRAKTGINRSGRVSVLNVWDLLKDAPRVYYQCWVHLLGQGRYHAQLGFVVPHPYQQTEVHFRHDWANAVLFYYDGTVRWLSFDAEFTRHEDHLPIRWRPGPKQGEPFEYACFLRVELDFDSGFGSLFINGQRIAGDLTVSPREFEPKGWGGNKFRLDRWGFEAPRAPNDHPINPYHPHYMDIDELEIGTWDEKPSDEEPPAPWPASP